MSDIKVKWLKDKDKEIFYPISHEKTVICGEDNDTTLDIVLNNKADLNENGKIPSTQLPSNLVYSSDFEIVEFG